MKSKDRVECIEKALNEADRIAAESDMRYTYDEVF